MRGTYRCFKNSQYGAFYVGNGGCVYVGKIMNQMMVDR